MYYRFPQQKQSNSSRQHLSLRICKYCALHIYDYYTRYTTIMGISHSKVDDEKEEWEDRLTHVGTAVVKKLRADHAHHHDKTWNITQSAMVGPIQQTPPVMTFTDEAYSEKINTQKWPENPAPIVGAGRHWHSDAFVDTMFDLMGKTTKWCDVMSLSPPIEDGYFMWKMVEALHKIAETAKGNKKPIVVRMMFGFGASHGPSQNDSPNKYAVDCELWREKLTKAAGAHLSEDANIELWVGAWRYCDGWNHAKIIAVDGKYVHTGGHNLWSYSYLQKDPVHDLSIVLEGDVAHDGHLFANAQWEYVNYREATRWGKFLSMFPDWMPRILVRATISEWPVGPGKAEKFAPSYDRSITIDGDNNKPPEGAVPVISVGRQGALVNGKPSDDALISMIDSSEKIIRMSLQSLAPMIVKEWLPAFYGWPTGIFQAMSRVMWDRGVSIQIVLTNLGSKYTTNKLIEIIECEIFKCMKQMYSNVPNVTDKIIEIIEKKLLKISFIRHKGGKKYFREKKPDDDEEDKKDHDEVCNHSKYIIVDDVCSYTGSQNLYVSNLAEWGVIVDDAKLTAKMLEDYWNPMWTASYDETDSDMNKVIDNVKNNFEDFGDATISTDEKAEDFLEAIMRDDAPRL